jgi:hypothetical protein
MEKKSKKTYKIFLVAFFIGVIGFASSFFMYLNTPSPIEINYDLGDEYTIEKSGLAFKSIDKSIQLESVIPTLDKFGVQEKGFSFSVRNTNPEPINYELVLVDDNSTIRNGDIRYQLIKNKRIVGIYNLSDDGIIDIGLINSNEEINYTIKIWLDYNSEIKVGTFKKKIGVKETLGDNLNKPILTDGMIPVYYDSNSNSWYKAPSLNEYNKWYSYEEGYWANAITVNSNKRKYYNESEVGTKIENEDINSMWVWIPRFNYSIRFADIDVDFVKKEDPAYLAFNFNNQELEGFWFTKFESGLNNNSECLTSSLTKVCNNSNNKLYFVPNYPFATKMTMANMFYAIRKMELKGNIYGFTGTGTKLNNDGTIKNDNNDIDIHMIRNSEWQAVALLSNSKYGSNNQVFNNNSVVTGKVYYEDEEVDYNVIGKGTKGSTNGNVTGIYDMSGGKREYVMIENSELSIFAKKSNSGFTTKVLDYYYDKEFTEEDTTLKLKTRYTTENIINSNPITRGGYKNVGNIFNVYSATDYISKVSLETNSRACLVIMKEENNEEENEG